MAISNRAWRGPALIGLLAASMLSTATPAHAVKNGDIVNNGIGGVFQYSQKVFQKCRKDGGRWWLCTKTAAYYDPVAVGVTSFTLVVEFDPGVYRFNEAESGPLGIFSDGGDAATTRAGSGTQPLEFLPDTGFNPGAPLPGSVLNFEVVGNRVNVAYDFASPINATTDVNVFKLAFDLLTPIRVDPLFSTVTYGTSGKGQFTQISGTCTTSGGGTCFSDNPSTTIDITHSFVPEPATWAMLVAGFGLTGAALRRRHVSAANRRRSHRP